MVRRMGDRHAPIDFRYLDLSLQCRIRPRSGLGDDARGVRVAPGCCLPRLLALYKPKKKWWLAEQADPPDSQEQNSDIAAAWRRNSASLDVHSDTVLEVLHDQTERRQVIVLPEAEANKKYQDQVVASLVALRRVKPDGRITARVLF